MAAQVWGMVAMGARLLRYGAWCNMSKAAQVWSMVAIGARLLRRGAWWQ